MAFSMTDDELKMRIRNGTPIKILAELNGCSDASIYNWMKKNGVTRPETKKDVKEEKDESDYGKLAVIAKIQHEIENLEEDIENLENSLKYARLELGAWRKLKEDYDK